MCTLPKPPAGRALSEGKEAPQAAFPSWWFPAQTKRRTEGIRVPVPLAWGGSSTLGKQPSSHTDMIKREERREEESTFPCDEKPWTCPLNTSPVCDVERSPWALHCMPCPQSLLILEAYAFDHPPPSPLLTSSLIFLLLSAPVLLGSTHK